MVSVGATASRAAPTMLVGPMPLVETLGKARFRSYLDQPPRRTSLDITGGGGSEASHSKEDELPMRQSNSRMKNNRMKASPFFIVWALLAAPELAAQTSGAPCNDQTRTLSAPAGTAQTETDCPVWSITVLGVTFTTPSSCPNSRTVRNEDTWTCGPQLEGSNCIAHGYQVNVKQFALGNPCPTFPSTLPQTLQEAFAAVACKELPETNSFNVWSAKVDNCPSGGGSGFHRERHAVAPQVPWTLENGPGTYWLHTGALDELGGERWPDPRSEAFAAIRTMDPSELPDVLAAVHSFHGSLEGITDLQAQVSFEFFGLATLGNVRNDHSVAGTILRDRRFNLVSTRHIDSGDASGVSVQEFRFDGLRFVTGERGSDCYVVYPAGSADAEYALQYDAQFAWPLLGWIQDPFWIPLVPGAQYESAYSDDLDVSEAYPDLPGFGRTLYSIDVSGMVPQPRRITFYDAAGNVTRVKQYSAYREIIEGVWRPTRIVEDHLEPSTGIVTLRVTVTIANAKAVTGEEARLPELVRAPSKWLVRLSR